MICILGPTASGKTLLATHTALTVGAEIISADSRQVYKGMDLGTGKDLEDYRIGEKSIPYHLIDIKEPGYEYNVFEFTQDFIKTYQDIQGRQKEVILCGGTGLYLEAILKTYRFSERENNEKLREELSQKTDAELIRELSLRKKLHNSTDTTERERLIRALEIAYTAEKGSYSSLELPQMQSFVFGISFERERLIERINERLEKRLQAGLVEEVKHLLDRGIQAKQLLFYGLEYKYVTLYLQGEMNYEEMFRLLSIAIRQFAKRQMTWFRRMEKNGIKIHWIDASLSLSKKVDYIREVARIEISQMRLSPS